MLSGKQRSYLRGQANRLEPIIHIGKDGITEGLIKQVLEALEAHELIKGRVLQNSLEEVEDVARQLIEECGAELVQVIGNVFILFKRNEEEPVYHLPD
ncbi:MAG TPA: ribosome assembly RNA-binding protein YhbY [Halanaerobiales bacterium]|nr:ribosome assembly RNA-binding protein YhbY [Halanaerobiales bacterium]